MYNTKRRTQKFDTDNQGELDEYDAILNNPLCSIIHSKNEKLTTRHFDDEGQILSQDDTLIIVITWEEKELV